MRKHLIILFTIFTIVVNGQSNKTIYIQPLGQVNIEIVNNIKLAVEKFYGYKCIINPVKDFTKDILAESTVRYDASKILNKFNSQENKLIITDKDIATRKGNINEWGIFGLGNMPGSTCVISTFRLKKHVPNAKFLERLSKVCIHEIGHNLGIPHCKSDPTCLMNDAGGTIQQVDREKLFICKNCLNKIKGK